MRTPRALVTGSTGFVGSHLTKHLRTLGWNVAVLVRPKSDQRLLTDLDQIQIYEHSGSLNSMLKIVEAAKPDVVFHLASHVISDHTPTALDDLVHSNILFGTQLVEAMTTAGINNLVNTGTGWQHFGGSPYSPVNLYAASKQAFESILQYYLEAEKLKVITLKLNDTYGSNDSRPKVLNQLKQFANSHSQLQMTDGWQELDLVHVLDVVEAYELAGQRLLEPTFLRREEYSVSSGRPIVLRDLVQLCRSAWNAEIRINWGGREYRSREMMKPWLGTTLPGWVPKISIMAGLRMMIDDTSLNQNVSELTEGS